MDNKNIKYILFMYIQNSTSVSSGTGAFLSKEKTEMGWKSLSSTLYLLRRHMDWTAATCLWHHFTARTVVDLGRPGRLDARDGLTTATEIRGSSAARTAATLLHQSSMHV
jgi:hypothetical protein